MTNHEYLVKRLNELEERTRRMETRLCKLMIALDVDPNGSPADTSSEFEPTLPRDYPAEDHSQGRNDKPHRGHFPALFKRRG